ncbi:hypothetical protein NPX13_g11019 [Xylaria arbuscula]|uniref:Uncharacterized protein n=1 Tax=Xylaria arbuscula TaxID=114810 RepID=A0A9W8N3N9_9PEZI|nr:hypothetical protein NPX13_g11019 [Xylaria arbuscula]
MSLRSILGGSGRVKKKSPSTLSSRPSAKRSPSSSSTSQSASPSPSWTSSLPHRKPGVGRRSYSNKATDNDDFFDDKLDDLGLVVALATDLNLRDTPQAIQYIQARMFAPVPDAAGPAVLA